MDALPSLSKSRFLSGCQCPLKLWYDTYQRELQPTPDEARQALFDMGTEVGELARRRYPGGVLVVGNPWEVKKTAARTRELMAEASVPAIYEATIKHRSVLTRVDVLVRAPHKAWDLVEVKASTRVKEPFDTDVAVQYWILKGAGVRVRRAGLLLLDRDYVYPGGEPDLDALFRFEDLTEVCESRLPEIEKRVAEFRAVLTAKAPPDIGIGDHCFTPYECPYYGHCSRDAVFPDHPIDMLPRLQGSRRDGLVERGIEAVEGIPDDYPLTEAQALVRECVLSGDPWVSSELAGLLEDVEWPLCFLDFEAAGYAIPRFPGTRPFDAVPFQFSCHVQAEPGAEPEHREFLAIDGGDPREPLARALLEALGERGSILVYSSYEARVIRDLAAWLPGLAPDLEALQPRLVDLLKIVMAHYCHPEFGGSYSIKSVLPVLAPELDYADLEIADGQAAARAWMHMRDSGDMLERARLEQALRHYCRRDSVAMLELRNALLAAARGEGDG